MIKLIKIGVSQRWENISENEKNERSKCLQLIHIMYKMIQMLLLATVLHISISSHPYTSSLSNIWSSSTHVRLLPKRHECFGELREVGRCQLSAVFIICGVEKKNNWLAQQNPCWMSRPCTVCASRSVSPVLVCGSQPTLKEHIGGGGCVTAASGSLWLWNVMELSHCCVLF